MITELMVDKRAAGERLDMFLASQLGLSRSQIQLRIKAGDVHVNKAVQPARYLVRSGDQLEFQQSAPLPAIATPVLNLPICYEDDDVLVIDKPARLTTHAGAGTSGQATVADFAKAHTTDADTERPGIVHRLDRDTSGLMLIAKTTEAKAFLQTALSKRQVNKTYLALVIGHPKPESATIELPLGRDQTNPLRQAVQANGRPATTSYTTTAVYKGFSLLTAKPRTGRTHQLRVHLAAIGHPIAGDTLYGAPVRQLGLKRQFLHASQLELTLPSGKNLNISSNLPKELLDCLSKLEI